MGSILTFVPHRAGGGAGRSADQSARATSPRAAGESAPTVIIFPGVRYERTLPAERAALSEQPAT